MTKREQNAVENFLASVGVNANAHEAYDVNANAHEAYENARHDCKSYKWSDEAMTLVIDGIGKYFASRKIPGQVSPEERSSIYDRKNGTDYGLTEGR